MAVSPHQYRAARSGAALTDRSDRVRLEISGADRAKFLQNVTTNEVKRLASGRGCEAFVTSLQGKTLGYVTLLVEPDQVLLRSAPGGLGLILSHFQKYGLFDQVTWSDVQTETYEIHVCGPAIEKLVSSLGLPAIEAADLAHASAALADRPIRVIREAPAGVPGISLIGRAADREAVLAAIEEAGRALGLSRLDADTFDVLRIEAGTPEFGRDVTAENLTQEVGRDERAISFVKGCYLGQETVARIDALGHVNKILKGFTIEATRVPKPGSVLEAGGKLVGSLTSTAESPGWGGPIALGMVRGSQSQSGTRLQVTDSDERVEAVVHDLPMQPPPS
jgi:folate-binding protein YgfZ